MPVAAAQGADKKTAKENQNEKLSGLALAQRRRTFRRRLLRGTMERQWRLASRACDVLWLVPVEPQTSREGPDPD